jgi:hypothetical protein
MRWAPVAAALLGVGCGGASPVVDESPPVEAEAPVADAAPEAADEPEASPPPLAWTPVGASLIEDVVAVWGNATDVYVGSDMGTVTDITSYGASTSTFVSGIVGAGWAADPVHDYAVTASDWEAQAGQSSAGALYRYAGDSSWTMVAAGPFYAAWGSSATDVYAGGPAGIAHATDGQTFALEGPAGMGILGVGGSGPGDIYATTSDPTATILHSSGDGNWTPVFAQPTGAAWAVWSGGPGDAYVIVSPAAAGDPDAFVLHESAGGWTSESVGQPGSVLVTIWGSGPDDVYVGGWHPGPEGRAGDCFHSTGDGAWSRVELPGNLYEVTSLWGRGARDVYVGAYDVDDGPTLIHGR